MPRTMMSPVLRTDEGAIFTPFIDRDGDHAMVGFMVQTGEGDARRVTYIYMNPSTSNGDGGPGANVFIYAGHSGQPDLDMPMTYIEA